MTRVLLAVLACAALAAGCGASHRRPAAEPPPRLLVGVDDDHVKWTARPERLFATYRDLGVRMVRVWIPWHGEARPRGVTRTYLARVRHLTAEPGIRVVLALFGFAADAPLASPAQRRYCGFVRSVLVATPRVRAVVIWNEANSAVYWPQPGAAAYEALLERCWDVVHALRPDAVVLDSTASVHGPTGFVREVGRAYRASGRTRPILDAVGHSAYPLAFDEDPGATHPPGAGVHEGDLSRLEDAYRDAFAGTRQPLPGERGVTVWYLESGFQTPVPAAKRRLYDGRETVGELASRADQARRLRESILLAACQPHVRAILNFELFDEHRLAGWQSGLLFPDWGRKPAYTAFRDAVRDLAAGRAGCSSPATGPPGSPAAASSG